jgi:uncharacterized protein
MSNHLASENSPYLLQHAENPVDWYPWGDEALSRARLEDKPIFLSIGYAACHWCHVMAHESFEDPETASFMNQHFVNVKVDREERPDIDSIYMGAVVAMTGQGGWPMSVFLTPEGLPFYGGTYFPPIRRYNMPSFREILLTVARLWREDRPALLNSAGEIIQHLKNNLHLDRSGEALQPDSLEQAAYRLAQAYDWQSGGWGQAPKFPQPMAIEFLLRRAARHDRLALDIATHALDAMALGGMYDVVGGGFARYSTDNKWLVPHFEKMLYDNAQLARVYLHAYLLTQRPAYRRVCEETLDFISRELMETGESSSAHHAGIYSSLDADSEGEEGKFYTWTAAEIRLVLSQAQSAAGQPAPAPAWAEFFLAAYAVSEAGNFEGKTVLQRTRSDADLAQKYNLPEDQIAPLLDQMHRALRQARAYRIRPGTDDKVLVAWNALALVAFAEAARYLDRPDYLRLARLNAAFLLDELRPDGHLLRSWRKGQARHNAYLEDYAALILGLLSLYQSDPDVKWFQAAAGLLQEMLQRFPDPQGGFFDTPQDHEALVLRPKDIQDNATPSGNALAAIALIQLAAYMGKSEWLETAEAMLRGIQAPAVRYPTAFAKWLCALDAALHPIQELAVLLPHGHSGAGDIIAELWRGFRPDSLVAVSTYPPSPGSPALLDDRPLLNNLPTAYLCHHFVCQAPVNTAQELRQQLEAV